MRALVTGARGFVGRHLVEHLLASGDDVVQVDRAEGDILDAVAIREIVEGVRPEVVYHLAGWADVGASWSDPRGALRVNAEGTLNVLEACREAGVGRVVSVISADVYGLVAPEELPLSEDAPLRPTSPYAASKVAADALSLQAFLGHGLEVVRARPFNHLGPGQSEAFVAPALAARIARAERDGASDVAVGNLTARRDFTDVRDVVRAYRMLAEDGEPGEVYNICRGDDVAVQDLVDRLLAMARRPIGLRVDPTLMRPVDLPALRGDASKLEACTGWKPERSLDQTLADLLEDMRARVSAEASE